ncbi:MAG TPA: DUF6677 family protein [Thermoanaerobaculaceae bacterium]|nr:DUF6677 family protein [Thermoanaerobaculaceae bacterium]
MAEESRPIGMSLPLPVLLGLAWLVPGLGHVLLNRRLRAAVFFVVVMVGFLLGIVLDGELMIPRAGDPLSYLATIASLGNGLLFFVARAVGLGQGVVTAAAYEFGNTFLLTAGMMNLLLVLDTHDIATGKKDW